MYAKVSGQYLHMIGCDEVYVFIKKKGGLKALLNIIFAIIGDSAEMQQNTLDVNKIANIYLPRYTY